MAARIKVFNGVKYYHYTASDEPYTSQRVKHLKEKGIKCKVVKDGTRQAIYTHPEVGALTII